MKRFLIVFLCLGGFVCFTQPREAFGQASTQGGQRLFMQNCLICHGQTGGEQRAPAPATLMQLSPDAILSVLSTGVMSTQAQSLTDDQKRSIATFLAGRPPGLGDAGDAKKMSNQCSANPPMDDPSAGPEWNGWGVDLANTRFQNAKDAGLSADEVPQLKLKWAFAFPNGIDTYGQPTLASGRVFVGSDNTFVYSLNAKTGCVYWSFRSVAGVHTPIVLGPGKNVTPPSGQGAAKTAAYFADMKSNVYAVNAQNGELLWKAHVDDHPLSHVDGAPTLYEGRLYVPVSSWEESAASSPQYACCTFRGSLVALDANTGKQIWKTYTIPDAPKPTRKNSDGVQLSAPAGGAVWNSPTIDAKRHVIYAGIGNGYTEPAAKTTDSIMAFDMQTGKILWDAQDLENDAWIPGCGPTNKGENCPEVVGPDYDFGGASMILKTLPDGHRVIIAGQKSGNVYAHDPDKNGAMIWKVNLAEKAPTNVGLIVFGGAADDNNAYFPLTSGGVAALPLATGETKWLTKLEPAPTADPPRRGEAAAATMIQGIVFSGGWDGILRALSTIDGKVIWEYNMVHDYDTVNDVPGKGGSMGGPGPTIAGGMLFAGSGYIGIRNGIPGNVLLAFGKD